MWAQITNALLGIWLMAAPSIFGYDETAAAANHHIVGPLIAASAFLSLWRVLRPLRLFGLPLGLWLVVSSGIIPQEPHALGVSLAGGVLVCFLAIPGHRSSDEFAGGWSSLFR